MWWNAPFQGLIVVTFGSMGVNKWHVFLVNVTGMWKSKFIIHLYSINSICFTVVALVHVRITDSMFILENKHNEFI